MKKHRGISYAKWGYLFILPFFIAYLLFSFLPQALTIYNSFFDNYRQGLTQIGPTFVGVKNYIKLFTPDKTGTIDILKYAGNTLILWVGGAIPQIVIALLLAIFFTSYRLNIKGQQFFKTVIYMPNLIMASAFSMLFFLKTDSALMIILSCFTVIGITPASISWPGMLLSTSPMSRYSYTLRNTRLSRHLPRPDNGTGHM